MIDTSTLDVLAVALLAVAAVTLALALLGIAELVRPRRAPAGPAVAPGTAGLGRRDLTRAA